jgi:hypothetical protein
MIESSDIASTPDEPAPRMSGRRRSAIAIAGASAVAGAVMVLSAVGAPSANAAATKFFVCKYVGTPGVDEHLQPSVNNPISVDASALPAGTQVGDVFADGQGRSFVIAADTTGNGGGQSGEPAPECPATPPGGGSSTPPPPPTSSTVVVVPSTVTESGTVTEVVTTTAAGGAAGQGAAGQPAQGPIPAGVNAGLHTTDSNAGLRAWGILLMLLGGAAGLVFGLRPSRGRAH